MFPGFAGLRSTDLLDSSQKRACIESRPEPICSHDAVILLGMTAAQTEQSHLRLHTLDLLPLSLWISFWASPHCIWPLVIASVKHTPFPGLSPPHIQTFSCCFCVSGQEPPLPSQSGVYCVPYFMAHHHHQPVESLLWVILLLFLIIPQPNSFSHPQPLPMYSLGWIVALHICMYVFLKNIQFSCLWVFY